MRDNSGGCERLRGQMNTVTPSTGLKHAQFLVKLHSSYMGHDWAHHGWLLFLEMKEKSQQESVFLFFLCTFYTGGCLSLFYRRMVSQLWSLKCVVSYLLRLAVYGASAPVELLVAEDACTSRGGHRGQTDGGGVNGVHVQKNTCRQDSRGV